MTTIKTRVKPRAEKKAVIIVQEVNNKNQLHATDSTADIDSNMTLEQVQKALYHFLIMADDTMSAKIFATYKDYDLNYVINNIGKKIITYQLVLVNKMSASLLAMVSHPLFDSTITDSTNGDFLINLGGLLSTDCTCDEEFEDCVIKMLKLPKSYNFDFTKTDKYGNSFITLIGESQYKDLINYIILFADSYKKLDLNIHNYDEECLFTLLSSDYENNHMIIQMMLLSDNVMLTKTDLKHINYYNTELYGRITKYYKDKVISEKE